MSLLSARLAVLREPANQSLMQLRKGLEKESLRVTPEGTLAQTPHPRALGSALTHPAITTDYSEALLEFITEPHTSTRQMLAELDRVQRYTYQCLDNEYLWGSSMPCMLANDASIPVGLYGGSNPGRMKTIYRLGLGERYGRSMQTIAGIHYNFSLGDEFWAFWHAREGIDESLQQFKNRRYFDLIRNFRRYFWLLLYLFGASPAVCRSFVKGRQHQLQSFGDDEHSLHLPYATSLRMGDLGYQSDAQSALVVSYNDLDSYIHTLCGAITQPYPDYVAKGLRDEQGNYKQLNTSLLQIENEFYSTMRPKCVARSGETALGALRNRGVEYVEVRCVDLNPYEPLGVSAEQIHFMDVFLVYCLLADSPQTDPKKYRRSLENQRRVVNRGRDPAMRLLSDCGEQSLPQWGTTLLDEMTWVANLLDNSLGNSHFSAALQSQRAKLEDSQLTPSARILADMQAKQQTFFRLALEQSISHAEHYRQQPLSAAEFEYMQQLALDSLAQQAAIEAQPQLDFDEYLRNYYAQYNCSS
ncbi:glutamate--cysteine ligase [Pseudomaricurvus alcaniphilus]|uniref:glutamate--cysteine ligase n=1 Tax=Pseudomaricurvus alcaniphilus TaxID=1166482 RepID=UPI00140810D9|nr:glutamate--cysteine ligase [Pseudomaricurvus alcaniphilus]NHN37125.1 glutamate--cysteine ligase [Pseudomaricurvus alcaniphilus]